MPNTNQNVFYPSLIGPAPNSLLDLMSEILHSGIRDGGSYGSAHEIPHSHTRFCSTSLDFGSELCTRITTFAECSGEKPWCHNVSRRCLANASVRSRRHFAVSVWSGYQLPLSGSTVWRSRPLLTSAKI